MIETARAAALLSLLANVALVGLKLGVGIAIGSISVLSDAVDSGMDLVGALIALVAVRLASRPADSSHPYGHGKIESLSGMAEGLLVLAAAGYVASEAASRLSGDRTVEMPSVGIAVMAVSMVINVGVSRVLLRTARETGSPALEASAWHRATDVFTSAGVLAGLVVVQVTSWDPMDAIAAIAVASFVAWTAFRLINAAARDLLDASLREDEEAAVREVLQAFAPEYVAYHGLRTRRSGSSRQIDLHLVMPRLVTVGDAHDLSDRIEAAIESRLPRSTTTIHFEPCEVPHAICDAQCGVGGGGYYCQQEARSRAAQPTPPRTSAGSR